MKESPSPASMKKKSTFPLNSLVLVIGVIIILMGVLLPGLDQAPHRHAEAGPFPQAAGESGR
jgi:competence protein ComGC